MIYFLINLSEQLYGIKYSYLIQIISTLKWFHIFLSHITNFKMDLFDPLIRPEKILPFWVWVNLGVMAIKVLTTLPRSPELESHYQMLLSVISKIPFVGWTWNLELYWHLPVSFLYLFFLFFTPSFYLFLTW